MGATIMITVKALFVRSAGVFVTRRLRGYPTL